MVAFSAFVNVSGGFPPRACLVSDVKYFSNNTVTVAINIVADRLLVITRLEVAFKPHTQPSGAKGPEEKRIDFD